MNRWTKKELKEDKFHDYGTDAVDLSVGDVIDTSTTGTSYYNDYLTKSGREYLLKKTGTEGKIVKMSPKEYFDTCSNKVFNTSTQSLIRSRRYDDETMDELHKVLTELKKKFPLPYINLADKQQEGLHRMLAIADLYGWDHEVPVLVIDYAEGEKDKREKEKHDREIRKEIESVIKDLYKYTYEDNAQVIYELEFLFGDDDFDVQFSDDSFKISRKGVTLEFDLPKYEEKRSDDMEDVDWSDIIDSQEMEKMSVSEFDRYVSKLLN